jgi:chromosome partitioning protein
MYSIAAVATKGGSGKTTLTTCLAVAAARGRGTVGLIDADPQRSLSEWCESRGSTNNPMLYTADAITEAMYDARAGGVDWLFIDTGPGLLKAIVPMVEAATFLIVPLVASSVDLQAIPPTLDVVRESGKPYLIVLNDCMSAKMDESAAELLSELGHPVAKQRIKARVAYRSAMSTGHTGPERDDKCAEEISALWDEVKSAVRGRKSRG